MPSVPAALTAMSRRPKRATVCVDQGADVVLVADVGADELGLGAGGAQFGDERRAGVVVTAGDDELARPLRA